MRTSALLLLLTTLAGPALAIDGVLEINQACAISTGCFAGDAPGLPVTISASGSYRLTSNLESTGANETIVNITTGDVTLDLNGHTIRCLWFITPCKGNGTGRGISAVGINNVKVRNGTVKDMGADGVMLHDFARVEDVLTIDNGGAGIGIGSYAAVVASTAHRNGGDGVSAGSSSRVSDCTSSLNVGHGIHGTGARARIEGNAVSFNSGYGIWANSFSTVIGNVVYGNSLHGIYLGYDTTYLQNTINGNTLGGVTGDGPQNLGHNYCSGLNVVSSTCP
jgi:hypothetical protein